MESTEWNPDEWQGRSEKQVDNNHKLTFLTIVGGIVVIAGCFIVWVLSKLI